MFITQKYMGKLHINVMVMSLHKRLHTNMGTTKHSIKKWKIHDLLGLWNSGLFSFPFQCLELNQGRRHARPLLYYSTIFQQISLLCIYYMYDIWSAYIIYKWLYVSRKRENSQWLHHLIQASMYYSCDLWENRGVYEPWFESDL